MTNTPYIFNTVKARYAFDSVDNDLMVTGRFESSQEIPQSLLDSIKTRREANDRRTFSEITKGDELEMMEIAEIPMVIWKKWIREGFDPHEIMRDLGPQQAAQMILTRLRAEDLTAFQLTSKTLH